MAYYDKKLGVYLPEKPIKPIQLEKPKKINKLIPPPMDPVIAELIKEEIEQIPTKEAVIVPPEPLNPPVLTPEEKKAIRIQEIREELAKIDGKDSSYHYEVDEDEVEWWICNICGKAYNSETVQKRHQTLKHK